MDRIIYINGLRGEQSNFLLNRGKETLISNHFKFSKIDVSVTSANLDYFNFSEFTNSLNNLIDEIKLKGNNLLIVGNSLGGLISMFLSAKTGVKSVLINPCTDISSIEILKNDIYNELHSMQSFIKSYDFNDDNFPLVFLCEDDKRINPEIFISKYSNRISTIKMIPGNGHYFEDFEDYIDDIESIISV